MTPGELDQILLAVRQEVRRGEALHPGYNSAHEAYGVILEELDEFWELVKTRHHDHQVMTWELLQVAATALRAIDSVTLSGLDGQERNLFLRLPAAKDLATIIQERGQA